MYVVFLVGHAVAGAIPGWAQEEGNGMVIIEKGESGATIVIGKEAAKTEVFAASELQNYLKKILKTKCKIFPHPRHLEQVQEVQMLQLKKGKLVTHKMPQIMEVVNIIKEYIYQLIKKKEK